MQISYLAMYVLHDTFNTVHQSKHIHISKEIHR